MMTLIAQAILSKKYRHKRAEFSMILKKSNKWVRDCCGLKQVDGYHQISRDLTDFENAVNKLDFHKN